MKTLLGPVDKPKDNIISQEREDRIIKEMTSRKRNKLKRRKTLDS